jgi:transcriptional regulator with GAF, ATPase, and Fis domain
MEAGASRGLWAMERDAVRQALVQNGWNQTAAARALGIPRHILIYRMKKYDICRP